MQIEIQQELKGNILKNRLYNLPSPVNGKGELVPFEERKSELKDFACLVYYGGLFHTHKSQSYMIIKNDSDNQFEEEVILLFNGDKIDTTFRQGDLILKCYQLFVLSSTRVTKSRFETIKSRLQKKMR